MDAVPRLAVRPEEPVGAAAGSHDLEVCEMSDNVPDEPQWLRDIEKELGLDNTPAPDSTPTPDVPEGEITLLEGIEGMEFTIKGWVRVYNLIMRAEQNPDLFRRVLKNSDDAMLFTAMIALPYQLSLAMGQDPEYCKKMVAFVAASYIIAMTRGYKMAQDDALKAE